MPVEERTLRLRLTLHCHRQPTLAKLCTALLTSMHIPACYTLHASPNFASHCTVGRRDIWGR